MLLQRGREGEREREIIGRRGKGMRNLVQPKEELNEDMSVGGMAASCRESGKGSII